MIQSEIFDKFSLLQGFENMILNNTMNTKYQTRCAWILFSDKSSCEKAIKELKDK